MSIGPVAEQNRIESIDTLRGFALLGILVMNIIGMALPMAAYFSPLPSGGAAGINWATWAFAHLFFDLKMMGLFSMLFGAGLVLMWQRAEERAQRFGGTYYRRIFWLLIIGLLHAYLLWHGDILVTYALCGFLLFLFRRRSARVLIISGIVVLIFGVLLSLTGGFFNQKMRTDIQQIEEQVAAGEVLSDRQQGLLDQWNSVRHTFQPTPAKYQETIQTMRGDLSTVLKANVEETIGMHTQAVPFMLFWRALALMLLGMGLMKAGVLTLERSTAFYRNWIIAGFGIGLPLILFGIYQWDSHNYDFIASFGWVGQYNYVGSVLVSMAYLSVIMLICRSGKLAGLRARLGAVGRLALTNYLMQTLIGVSIFYGYGLGLFGSFDRFTLWFFILGIWALQLMFSPWWLERYQFGPAEWLWRTLTYWRMQPMRQKN